MSCSFTHKCGKCTRIVASEKRAEERDEERAERKREKRRRKKNSGNWAIYTAIVIPFIMAVGVVSKTAETTTAKQSIQQGEIK